MTEPTRQPRVLRVIKPAGDSPELPMDRQTEATEADIKKFRSMVQGMMRTLCVTADISEGCQVLTVKMADLITRGIEGQMDTLIDYGENVKAELKVAYRKYEQNEIDDENITRLERRLAMLREQWSVLKDFCEAAKENGAQMRLGLNFDYPAYRSMKAIREDGRRRRMMRESLQEANRLLGLSEPEYRRHLANIQGGPRLTHGIESDDGYGNGMQDKKDEADRQHVSQLLKKNEDRHQ